MSERHETRYVLIAGAAIEESKKALPPVSRAVAAMMRHLRTKMSSTSPGATRVMTKAQQTIINAGPGQQLMPIATEKEVILFPRTMAQLARAEHLAASEPVS